MIQNHSEVLLQAGELSVSVLPSLGAGISQLSWKRNETVLNLMRPAPKGCSSASDTNFLLAPYSNRIRDARFSFAGKEHQLRGAEKHAIHGDIRSRQFEVLQQSDCSLVLQFQSASVADFNYPWPLTVQVRYDLTPSKLSVVIEVENCADEPVPVGAGFHPYFPRRFAPGEEVELEFNARGIYLYDDGLPLPTAAAVRVPENFSFASQRALVEGIDHCYSGWGGLAKLRWPETMVGLDVTGTAPVSHLVLYTPQGSDYFAVEPVSNCTDAFNLAAKGFTHTGMVVLKPKARMAAQMEIAVVSL